MYISYHHGYSPYVGREPSFDVAYDWRFLELTLASKSSSLVPPHPGIPPSLPRPRPPFPSLPRLLPMESIAVCTPDEGEDMFLQFDRQDPNMESYMATVIIPGDNTPPNTCKFRLLFAQ